MHPAEEDLLARRREPALLAPLVHSGISEAQRGVRADCADGGAADDLLADHSALLPDRGGQGAGEPHLLHAERARHRHSDRHFVQHAGRICAQLPPALRHQQDRHLDRDQDLSAPDAAAGGLLRTGSLRRAAQAHAADRADPGISLGQSLLHGAGSGGALYLHSVSALLQRSADAGGAGVFGADGAGDRIADQALPAPAG